MHLQQEESLSFCKQGAKLLLQHYPKTENLNEFHRLNTLHLVEKFLVRRNRKNNLSTSHSYHSFTSLEDSSTGAQVYNRCQAINSTLFSSTKRALYNTRNICTRQLNLTFYLEDLKRFLVQSVM